MKFKLKKTSKEVKDYDKIEHYYFKLYLSYAVAIGAVVGGILEIIFGTALDFFFGSILIGMIIATYFGNNRDVEDEYKKNIEKKAKINKNI